MFNWTAPNFIKNLIAKAHPLKMSVEKSLSPQYLPPVHRDMKVLNRDLFYKKVGLVSVGFPDPKCLQNFMKSHRGDLLNLRSVSNIVEVGTQKRVLLNDRVHNTDFNSENVTSNIGKDTLEFLLHEKSDLKPYILELTYKFWRMEEILDAILPVELLSEVPTSFTIVGHIAHFNLREEYLPYKHLIGQVVMDKNTKIKTVVNKTSSIGTEFRTFPMELIAGEPLYDVEQLESGCVFKFNFKDVYWNSRLQAEHRRLITEYFKRGEVICDAMAGVGPFAVPGAKKKCIVLANDLNPESYKYLVINKDCNKVDSFLRCFNIDGAQMIKESSGLLMKWYNENNGEIVTTSFKKEKSQPKDSQQEKKDKGKMRKVVETVKIPKHISHFVMNLPDSALTFLPNYIGIYANDKYQQFIKEDSDFKLPMIHVYCFEKFSPEEVPPPSFEELESRLEKRVNKILDYEFAKGELKFHVVRKVAPTKYMYCVSFELPKELAFESS